MSTTVPVTICPVPSVVTVAGAEQLATPAPARQRNCTVTFVVWQPATAPGKTSAAIVGGVPLNV